MTGVKTDKGKEKRRKKRNGRGKETIDIVLDAFQCPVCYDVAQDPIMNRSCHHVFCAGCIQQHSNSNPNCGCPMCRTALAYRPLSGHLLGIYQQATTLCPLGCDRRVGHTKPFKETHMIYCTASQPTKRAKPETVNQQADSDSSSRTLHASDSQSPPEQGAETCSDQTVETQSEARGSSPPTPSSVDTPTTSTATQSEPSELVASHSSHEPSTGNSCRFSLSSSVAFPSTSRQGREDTMKWTFPTNAPTSSHVENPLACDRQHMTKKRKRGFKGSLMKVGSLVLSAAECPVCFEIDDSPQINNTCHHIICTPCVENIKAVSAQHRSQTRLLCPVCRATLDCTQLRGRLSSTIKSASVPCSLHCGKRHGRRPEDLEQHRQLCPKFRRKCPTCSQKMPQSCLLKHKSRCEKGKGKSVAAPTGATQDLGNSTDCSPSASTQPSSQAAVTLASSTPPAPPSNGITPIQVHA